MNKFGMFFVCAVNEAPFIFCNRHSKMLFRFKCYQPVFFFVNVAKENFYFRAFKKYVMILYHPFRMAEVMLLYAMFEL
jgi:hypothetical protein